MKQTIKFGPLESMGISKVLAALQGDLSQKRIVTDLFDYFQMTEDRKKEIGFELLSDQKKMELGFRRSDQVTGWNPATSTEQWSVDLSSAEVEVLQLAMERYDKWELSDRWEPNITKQLRKEDNNGNKKQP